MSKEDVKAFLPKAQEASMNRHPNIGKKVTDRAKSKETQRKVGAYCVTSSIVKGQPS